MQLESDEIILNSLHNIRYEL